MNQTRNLTEGSVFRAILHLGIPTIAISLLQSTFNLVDMFFVGRLGPTALAAVTVSGIVIALLITVAIGISMGTLALVSRYWGARRFQQAARVVGQSLYISIFLSLCFGLGGWFLARPILSLLGARGGVLEQAVVYFRIISAGAGTIFIFVTFSSALKASGDVWTPFKVMALGVVLNCVLDPLLIFGRAGLPRLGVQGSAVATIISRLVTVVIIILLARGKSTYFDLSRAFGRIDFPLMAKIIRIGFFGSVEMLIRSLAMIALLRLVSPFGTAALAAYGIGARVRGIILMPGIGMGYAAGTLVGQNLGAGLAERARRSVWMAWRIYQVMIFPVIVLLLLFPREVIGFFNRDPRVLAAGQVFISYIAVSFLFLSFTLVLGKALHGAGDTLGPMVITGISLIFLGIPLAYIGSRFQGVDGIWQGILAAAVLNGLLIILRFRRGGWTRLKFMEE